MKMVREITPAAVILYIAIREILFFSSSKSSCSVPRQDDDVHLHHQASFTNIYQISTYARTNHFLILFTILGVLLGIYSHLSASSSKSPSTSQPEEISISSFIDDWPSFSYEGLKREKDNKLGYYTDYFIPAVVYVESEEEKPHKDHSIDFDFINEFFNSEEVVVYGLPYYGYGDVHDDHQEEYEDEFVPRIVHVEYYKKEEEIDGGRGDFLDDEDNDCEKIYDQKDIVVHQHHHHHHGAKDESLIGNFEEFGNYEYGDDEDVYYEEEEEEDYGYEDQDDADFNKRIEKFIDYNVKKWREELQNDMLLLLDS